MRCHAGIIDRAGVAEVGKFHAFHPVLEQDVRRLDVAIDWRRVGRGSPIDRRVKVARSMGLRYSYSNAIERSSRICLRALAASANRSGPVKPNDSSATTRCGSRTQKPS